MIESVDRALPALLALAPDVLCVTGDHSTPVPMRGHSWHPVPALVLGRGAAPIRRRASTRRPRGPGSLGHDREQAT